MLTSTTSESQSVDDAANDVLLPLYQRLAAHYSAAIELGSLKPGERMPSVRELMARHDISLSTALQVLRFLEAQGCLEARPRVGYFVCATRAAGWSRRPRRRSASTCWAAIARIWVKASSMSLQSWQTAGRI